MRFNIYRDRNKSLGLLPSGKHIIYWTRGIHFDNILTVRGLEDLEPAASNTHDFFILLIFTALVTATKFTGGCLRIYFDVVLKIKRSKITFCALF